MRQNKKTRKQKTKQIIQKTRSPQMNQQQRRKSTPKKLFSYQSIFPFVFGGRPKFHFFSQLVQKRAPPKHYKNRGFSKTFFGKQLCVTKRPFLDNAKAHGRVHAQLGDEQDFLFWQNMGKHNLVLWLDYTEEATTYHTLDMSMWGAVRYRRTFSYDDCNMVQSLAIDHKYSPSAYRTTVPIHSGKGFFTEFWYDPQALDTAYWLCDSFADFIAPVSFVLLSYMDEMALNATRKNRARKEATLKELKVYARLFIEAKSAEIKSRSARHAGCCVVFRTAKRMLSRQTALRQHDQVCDFFVRMLPPMGGLSATLTSRLRSFRGKVMHQIAMLSVNFLQKQVNRGI